MSKVYTIRFQNIGIRKFEFEAKTQLFYRVYLFLKTGEMIELNILGAR